MRYRILFAAVALSLPLTAPAGDPPVGAPPTKDEYAELSKLIHKMVLKEVPRQHEEKFDWGTSIPIPDKLVLPGLPRTYVKVGDTKQLAHGNWKRIVVKIDEPEKNFKIKVTDFKRQEKGGYRILLDAEAFVRCDGEVNQFLRGLLVLQVTGQADATITSSMACDVDIKINLKKFPPEVNVEPKIVEMALDLKQFNLNKVGGTVQGERIRQLGNDLMPDFIRGFMKAAEPMVKDYANQALIASLKESKGKFSAVELLKAVPKEKEKKEK